MRLLPAILLISIVSCSVFGQTYTISTFAGGALPVNIPGTSASLGDGVPQYIAADRAGNLFFPVQHTVLRLDATTGVLTLVAGNGTTGFSGDNGPATSAQLNFPAGVAVDSAGNLYIADSYNNRVRKVSNGVITTVAGNGTFGFSGDNGPATSAQFGFPYGLAVDSAGNLYIADSGNRIRKVSNGVITTVAGNGTTGFSGDNGPATSAQLSGPRGVSVDSAGNLYIADANNNGSEQEFVGALN
jgi:sugar lactone lactonase YvrE